VEAETSSGALKKGKLFCALALHQPISALKLIIARGIFLDEPPVRPSSMDVQKIIKSVDYSWTTGGDQMVFHGRKIGSGGYGEVHEVLFVPPKS